MQETQSFLGTLRTFRDSLGVGQFRKLKHLHGSCKDGVVLLSLEGKPVVRLYPSFLGKQTADEMYRNFDQECEWIISKVKIMGKLIPECRESCLQSSQGSSYTYSGMERKAHPLSNSTLELGKLLRPLLTSESDHQPSEETLPNMFLMNRYDSTQYICEHSDDEKQMDQKRPIFSLSLGQPRVLVVREKRKALKRKSVGGDVPRRSWRYEIWMEHGSMLEFCPGMQENFSHEVIKPRKSKNELALISESGFSHRINVTARYYSE